MSNQDLFTALNMFKQSVGELKIQRTIAGANEAVQQIRGSELDDAAKQTELRNVANSLTMQMAGLGAPATTIQQVAGAVAPGPTAQENAVFESGLIQQRQSAQNAFAASESAKDRALKMQLDAADQNKTKPLTEGQINKIHSFDEDHVKGSDILNRFKANPDLVNLSKNQTPRLRALVNTEFGAFKADVGQWFDSYRQRVTGAGASEGEIKMLMQNRPNLETDTADLFEKKVNESIRIGNLVKKRYLTNLKKGKRDVSGYLDEADVAEKETGSGDGAFDIEKYLK